MVGEKKKTMWFSAYGELEFIPRETYLSGNYRYVCSDTEEGTLESFEAGDELFDVVANNDTEEYYYTQI